MSSQLVPLVETSALKFSVELTCAGVVTVSENDPFPTAPYTLSPKLQTFPLYAIAQSKYPSGEAVMSVAVGAPSTGAKVERFGAVRNGCGRRLQRVVPHH